LASETLRGDALRKPGRCGAGNERRALFQESATAARGCVVRLSVGFVVPLFLIAHGPSHESEGS